MLILISRPAESSRLSWPEPVAAGRGGQVGAIAPGRRQRGGAAAAPGEGAILGEGDFVAML